MSEQKSKRTETEDVSQVDQLLSLLGHLSQRDPSPALRDRLAILAAQRLQESPVYAPRLRAMRQRKQAWLKPALATALLLAAGVATGFVVHLLQHSPALTESTARVNHPAIPLDRRTVTTSVMPPPVSGHTKVHRQQSSPAQNACARQMIIRLPYSNSAIETGTDTTIRVSMSQSELLALGFPINTTAQDRRIVAELTLGDDGLPRAISVPLPLEVMKEHQ
jgi:hypothetical protein